MGSGFYAHPHMAHAIGSASGSAGDLAGLFVGLSFFAFMAVMALFSIGALILWIWAIIDCLTRTSLKTEEKILWILVLLFTHWIGAIVYYFVVKRPQDSLKN